MSTISGSISSNGGLSLSFRGCLIEPLLKKEEAGLGSASWFGAAKRRQKLIDEFQTKPECADFSSRPTRAARGPNLVAANTAISGALPWKAAVLERRARASAAADAAGSVFARFTEQTIEEIVPSTLSVKFWPAVEHRIQEI
jgi:hypothetical protein